MAKLAASMVSPSVIINYNTAEPVASASFSESYRDRLIDRWNAFEEGGIVAQAIGLMKWSASYHAPGTELRRKMDACLGHLERLLKGEG